MIMSQNLTDQHLHMREILEVDHDDDHLIEIKLLDWLIHYTAGVGIELKRRQLTQQTTTMLVQ